MGKTKDPPQMLCCGFLRSSATESGTEISGAPVPSSGDDSIDVSIQMLNGRDLTVITYLM